MIESTIDEGADLNAFFHINQLKLRTSSWSSLQSRATICALAWVNLAVARPASVGDANGAEHRRISFVLEQYSIDRSFINSRCLCVARWKEAFDARGTMGDMVVPKVLLEATHEDTLVRTSLNVSRVKQLTLVLY